MEIVGGRRTFLMKTKSNIDLHLYVGDNTDWVVVVTSVNIEIKISQENIKWVLVSNIFMSYMNSNGSEDGIYAKESNTYIVLTVYK